MKVDPSLIALYITEDPNTFNLLREAEALQEPPTATAGEEGAVNAPATPAAQAAKDKPLNNREKAMLVMIGNLIDRQIPETQEYYEKMGRSAGFLDKVSNDELWNKISPKVRRAMAEKFILSVSNQ